MSSIATGMERRVPGREARRGKARRGESRRGCTPRALYVPDDLQLMSYLGQSTPGIVRKGLGGEECEGEGGSGDTITAITEQERRVIGLVIKEKVFICSSMNRN